jgi:hypothetical protein
MTNRVLALSPSVFGPLRLAGVSLVGLEVEGGRRS